MSLLKNFSTQFQEGFCSRIYTFDVDNSSESAYFIAEKLYCSLQPMDYIISIPKYNTSFKRVSILFNHPVKASQIQSIFPHVRYLFHVCKVFGVKFEWDAIVNTHKLEYNVLDSNSIHFSTSFTTSCGFFLFPFITDVNEDDNCEIEESQDKN